MGRGSWRWAGAVLLGLSAAACSVIIGLEPPPPDASPTADAAFPEGDAAGDGETGTDAGVPVCTALDAGADGDTTVYFPLNPVTQDDSGTGTWEWFDTSLMPKVTPKAFGGGTFDGRYVYFAGRGTVVARYDTTTSFVDPTSWLGFNVSKAPLNVPGGFDGAVFDGRYVYFIPYEVGGTTVPAHVVARYDSQGTFDDAASWDSFDTSLLDADGGVAASGFFGGTFDGRYLYLLPHNDGAPDGRVVRYDTAASDAGAPDTGQDGGDGGVTDWFGDPANWSSFDVASVNPLATGFWGAVFDGTSLYLAPQNNGAFGSVVHSGESGVTAKFRTNANTGFMGDASWSTFDMSKVNGLAFDYAGAGFDGRYVYYVPHGTGVTARFDTQSGQFGATAAWSTYDITRIVTTDGGSISYAGAAFDGRFMYFIPSAAGFATLVRYDTQSTFTSDCAWEAADLTTIDAGGFVPGNYDGAVFDGQYLYLVPNTNGLVARFKAKTPASMPALPAFHGSFF